MNELKRTLLCCKAFSHVTPLYTLPVKQDHLYFCRALYNIGCRAKQLHRKKPKNIMETQIGRHYRSKKAIMSLFSLNQFSVGSVQFNNSVKFIRYKTSLVQQ